MDTFNIKIVIPTGVEEYDLKLNKYLSNKAYSHDYDTFLPPHKRVVTFNNVNEQVVGIIKSWFMEAYKNHPHARLCSFQVSSSDNFQV